MPDWMIYSFVYSWYFCAFFVFVHYTAWLIRDRKWNRWDSVLMVWSVVFCFTALFYGIVGAWLLQPISVAILSDDTKFAVTLIMIPSCISIVFMRKAWGSNRVGLSVLVGSVIATIAAAVDSEYGLMFIAPSIWNASYLLGCVLENCRKQD